MTKDREHAELMKQIDRIRDREIAKMTGMTGVVVRDARERQKRRESEITSLNEIKVILEEVKGIKMEIELLLLQIRKVVN